MYRLHTYVKFARVRSSTSKARTKQIFHFSSLSVCFGLDNTYIIHYTLKWSIFLSTLCQNNYGLLLLFFELFALSLSSLIAV